MSAVPSPYPALEPPPPGDFEPVWWPINAAQQAAMNSKAELLLYGGASGGGKTQMLAADAMDEYENPRLRGLLIRTTLEEQQELEDLQQRMYEPKGARWIKKRWRFPSGATIRPGYLAHDKHLRRYQGNPYSWLGIDESGQHPEHRIKFMIGWPAAPTGSGLRVRGRFTSNPGDVGHSWQMADESVSPQPLPRARARGRSGQPALGNFRLSGKDLQGCLLDRRLPGAQNHGVHSCAPRG
jgi:hypothetical protein